VSAICVKSFSGVKLDELIVAREAKKKAII
jgi:hypothetical protein